MESEVKRGKGIDELASQYTPQKVEEEKVIAGVESKFASLTKQYRRYIRDYGPKCTLTVNEVLTPPDIETFIRLTELIEVEMKNVFARPSFIGYLIQNSYDAGHNDFHFSTTRSPAYYHLATGVKASEERPCNIIIEGYAGDGSCSSARHVNLTVHGDADSNLGQWAKHSNVTVHGSCNSDFGIQAEDSNFIIDGNVGRACGRFSMDSTFFVKGQIFKEFSKHHSILDEIPGSGARGSTFKTPHLKELMTLSLVPAGNRIIYIHPDGREEIARDFEEEGLPR